MINAARRVPLLIASVLCAAMLGGLASPAFGQDTHVLIVAGVGGDEAHVTQFNAWSLAIADAVKRQGASDANVWYLGENPDQSGGRMKARATRENVTKAFADLAARAKINDEIIVMLIGHGSFDGKTGAFNLPGPDLTAGDFATLLGRLPTRNIVFVNTASASGAFLEPLAGPERTIVTATKTGGERNETRFTGYFVEALNGDGADRDRNGRTSVLEAFDYAAAKVKAAYEQEGHILTEHATLDDGHKGQRAAMQFFAPDGARAAATQTSDPAARALLEQRDALERQVAELRLRKDTMPAAEYEQELERLVTEMALKTRAIRDLEGKK